ncbi:cadherin domain-containing protein [Microvirga subterranea]|uniref:Cadherin domain-containing protein n=1 Tax=Microvirga subterranea TaxID=186651 RepID=A0A370HKD0_9HYPH|nr:cadherin domain-containing protein [Microvirga subterranea]RDI58887.1 cadherin domain-containing protein [Microvirga subterranea]
MAESHDVTSFGLDDPALAESETTARAAAGLSAMGLEPSGASISAASIGMIIEYDGLTTIPEMPIHTSRLGTLSVYDPEDRLFRDFYIGAASVAGAFDILREETEYGPVWSLIVKDPNLFDYETAHNHQIWVKVVGQNRDGSSAETIVTLNMTNVDDPGNDAPEGITLSNTSIAENSGPSTVIGNLGVVDIDSTSMYGNDSWTFDLIFDPSGKFELWSLFGTAQLRLKSGMTLNYEEKQFYAVKIRVTDSGGLYFENFFTINVNDVVDERATNHAPMWLRLSGGTNVLADETIGGGAVVGTVSAFDQDGGDILAYQIVDDPDDKFYLYGNELRLKPTAHLDAETATAHSVSIRVRDLYDATYTDSLTVYVNDVNERPDGISLSKTSIKEKGETIVGDLTGSDPDGPGETLSFAIVSDQDSKFAIEGNQLKLRTGATLDAERKTSHSVTISVTDQGGLTYTKAFTINVENVPEAPTDIRFSSDSVYENSEGGTRIAYLTAVDEDSTEFEYSLIADLDNKFQIVGNELQVRPGAVLNFESAQKKHSVTVQAKDESGNVFTKIVWIYVLDANDAPFAMSLSPTSLAEGQGGRKVGFLSTSDYDAGVGDNNHLYTILADADSKFEIRGKELWLKEGAVLDYETKKQHSVTIRTTDRGNASFDKTFNIVVTNVNETPNGLILSNDTVPETLTGLQQIGILQGSDPDGTTDVSRLKYTIVSDQDQKFYIATGTNVLRLRDGATLNFDQPSHQVTVRTTDLGGLWFERTFTIHVTRPQQNAPTDVILTGSTTLREDIAAGSQIGTLAGSDPDAGSTFTYAITNDESGKFEIPLNSNVLKLKDGVSLNYETGQTHYVTIRVTDQTNLSYLKTFTFTVTDANERPYDIELSGTHVLDENNTAEVVVGDLQAFDPDLNDTAFEYSIVGSQPQFRISGRQLIAKPGLDHEGASFYDITIRASDRATGGLSYDKVFRITVADLNDAPDGLTLSGDHKVEENSAGGTLIGVLEGSDQDGDALTYSLYDDPDRKFEVVGNKLQVREGAGLDYRPGQTHQVTVQVSDGNKTYRKTFTITVTDVPDPEPNHAPTNLKLSSSTVQENIDAGTTIALLTGYDQDGGDVLTYSLVGDPDSKFALVGNRLVLRDGATINYEIPNPAHDVTLRVTDRTGAFFEKTFTLAVLDGPDGPNAAPTGLTISQDWVDENSPGGTFIGALNATDSDGNRIYYAIVDDPDQKFDVLDGTLVVREGAVLDYEATAQHQHEVTVKAYDRFGAYTTQIFTIHVKNVPEPNRAPTALDLSDTEIEENSRPGTEIGTLSAQDPDVLDDLRYFIVEDQDSKFAISGNKLVLRAGATLNREDKETHKVTIEVRDQDGASFRKVFEIHVGDVPDPEPNHAPYDLALSNDSMNEFSEWGTVVGLVAGFDQDGGDTLTYSVITGPDGVPSKFHIINGNQLALRDGAVIDHQTEPTVNVIIRATDQAGETFDKTFTITINDIDESSNGAPVGLTLSNSIIRDGTVGGIGGTRIGTLSAVDPNGDRLLYSIDYHEKFILVGDELRLREGQTVDDAEAQSYQVEAYVYDRFMTLVHETFTITVQSNRAPSNVTLSNTVVNEGAANGLTIGRLSATDLDRDPVSFSLVDDAGGRFVLAQEDGHTVLKVANGVKIDYEHLPTLSIKVRADDGHQGVTDQVIQINIRNVLTESLHGTEGADRLQGGISYDEFWGMGGNDTLIGGAGNDTLWGGEGEDTFVFHRFGTGNSDLIKDFDAAQDEIVLVQSNAATALNVGVLSSEAFCYGTQAADADDRIIYDRETGRLLYDSDGNGGRAAFEVAIFENRTVLDHTHFVVSQFLI